ncbi:MAG TPA: protein phosphatase 2C domain-containing protein [Gammaproteobacteria bacterium]
MSVLEERVQLFLGATERAEVDRELPQGLVALRSIRSPEKDTPNEDAAAIIALSDDALVLAVADGVGGTPAGREASNLTVSTLSSVLGRRADESASLRPAILDAIEQANRSVIDLARGAATTLVVAEIVARRLRSYHVGDSELIAVGQRGRVKRRVVPHSPTGFAVEAGLMDEDEAVQHEQRHVLFNVIGAEDMRVEIGGSVKLAPRDTVLLASDGLLDNLFADEIVDIIRIGPIAAAADRLVEKALRRMKTNGSGQPSKPDDLTIILFRPYVPKAQVMKPLPRPPEDAVPPSA